MVTNALSQEYLNSLFSLDESSSANIPIQVTNIFQPQAHKKTKQTTTQYVQPVVLRDDMTVSQLLELYEKYLTGGRKVKLGADNFNEYKRYISKKGILQNIWRVFFSIMDMPIYTLTNYNIHQYICAYQHKFALRNSTMNRSVTNLRGMLTWGYKMGLLHEHKLTGFQNLPVDEVNNLGVRRFLSEEEINRLMRVLRKREAERRNMRIRYNKHRQEHKLEPIPYHPLKGEGYTDYVFPMILLSLFTGARKGSVRGLKWRDINFVTKEIIFQAESSKTAKTNVVPMTDKLSVVLSLWKKQNNISNSIVDGNRYVFTGRDGVTPLDASCPRCWKKLLEDAKIESFRWHDLRHTFATLLVQKGVDIETLKTLMGHANINTTAIYLHSTNKHMHNSVKHLNNIIHI